MSFYDHYQVFLFIFALWYGFVPYRSENAGEMAAGSPAIYYAVLKQTAPAGWVFGVVWPILYALIVASHYTYWHDGSHHTTLYHVVLVLFLVNLLLNKTWSPLFFRGRQPKAAMVVLVLTGLTAVALAVLTAIDGIWLSFGLLLPYIVWLAYATYLNQAFITGYEEASKGVPENVGTKGAARKLTFI